MNNRETYVILNYWRGSADYRNSALPQRMKWSTERMTNLFLWSLQKFAGSFSFCGRGASQVTNAFMYRLKVIIIVCKVANKMDCEILKGVCFFICANTSAGTYCRYMCRYKCKYKCYYKCRYKCKQNLPKGTLLTLIRCLSVLLEASKCLLAHVK